MDRHVDSKPDDFNLSSERQLRRLFAEADTSLPEEAFLVQLSARLKRDQRKQRLQATIATSVVLTILVLVATPLRGISMQFNEELGQATLQLGAMFTTDAGWLSALLVAWWVLVKARVFKRG